MAASLVVHNGNHITMPAIKNESAPYTVVGKSETPFLFLLTRQYVNLASTSNSRKGLEWTVKFLPLLTLPSLGQHVCVLGPSEMDTHMQAVPPSLSPTFVLTISGMRPPLCSSLDLFLPKRTSQGPRRAAPRQLP